MKVGILTWYQAINHGAVLQTYASAEMLKSMGADPVVLNYKWAIYDEEDRKSKFVRRLKNFSPARLVWYLCVRKLFAEKTKNFKTFVAQYLNIGKKYNEEKDLDAAYIGSDMVFDITEGYNAYMHGEGVLAPYKFSYAASFGYSTIEMLKKSGHYFDIKGNLNCLGAIGYRDQKTLEICKQLGVTAPMVETVDPVLCYGFEKEIDKWDTFKWKNRNYLLVYAYDSTMNDRETVREIKRFAKGRGLEVISCGYYHKWCDQCIPADPKEFLEMFKYAKYLITDTFHGTVFSLILHKQFTSIIRENGFKVQYLLKCVHLESQISEFSHEIAKSLCNTIDYSCYDKWVGRERNKSRQFIMDNLERAKEVR